MSIPFMAFILGIIVGIGLAICFDLFWIPGAGWIWNVKDED